MAQRNGSVTEKSGEAERVAARLSMARTIIYSLVPVFLLTLLLELGMAAYVAVQEGSLAPWRTHSPVLNIQYFTRGSVIKPLASVLMDNCLVFDSTLGLRFRPSSWVFGEDCDAERPGQLDMEHRLAVNQYGFVANTSSLHQETPYSEIARSPTTLRVLLTGGSTTAGWGASDNEHVWGAVLDRMLRD